MEAYEKIQAFTQGKWRNGKDGKDCPPWFKTVSEFPDQYIRPSECVFSSSPSGRVLT